MDRDGVRGMVVRAMELGSVPDADEVVRRLEEGLEDQPLDEYRGELAARADDLLKQMLDALSEPDRPEQQPDTTVEALLDEMYPC